MISFILHSHQYLDEEIIIITNHESYIDRKEMIVWIGKNINN